MTNRTMSGRSTMELHIACYARGERSVDIAGQGKVWIWNDFRLPPPPPPPTHCIDIGNIITCAMTASKWNYTTIDDVIFVVQTFDIPLTHVKIISAFHSDATTRPTSISS